MTQLLVSVRNAAEAARALAAGAQLIDVKEPRHGSLGAASENEIRQVVAAVGGRAPVSAALGELNALGTATSLAPALVPEGVMYAKLGLAGMAPIGNWSTRWRLQLALLPPTVGAVAVAYADWEAALAPAPWLVLEHAIEFGCVGLLVDTFEKSGGPLFAHLGGPFLAQLMGHARQAGLFTVLAGSLTFESISQAVELHPHYVAVRGAACVGQRHEELSGERVSQLAQLVRESVETAAFTANSPRTNISSAIA